ncbi:MAG TPA: DUF1553 domain-containing protein, partial [Gemmataceae bacterium]|nr:DUF1553 domain-containing protein [Gemmataceae bacterium]
MLAPDELVLGVSVGKEARAYPLNAFRPGHCATPENFGTSGDPPTHPELLEWLSSQLVANGWQVKP